MRFCLFSVTVVAALVIERSPGVSYTVETRRGRLQEIPVDQVAEIESRLADADEEAFTYRDIVFLHSGLVFRGTIVQELPGESIVLVSDGGLPLTFGLDSVWRIAAEKCASDQSRAAIGAHPTGKDLRREFRIQLTVSRLESEQASDDQDSRRTDRLREELAELEAEQAEESARLEEGRESIDRLTDQLGELQGEAGDLATELAQRALSCTEGMPEAEQAVLDAYNAVDGNLDYLHTTALSRTQVDPRLLTEQVALEREMRRTELTALLAAPIPPSGPDPLVDSLVPVFTRDERRAMYREHRVRPRPRYTMLNLIPAGLGSFLQGDYRSGMVAMCCTLGGFVLMLDANSRISVAASQWTTYAELLATPYGSELAAAAGLLGGGYLYSLIAPSIYRWTQNARLRDTLRVDEKLEADE